MVVGLAAAACGRPETVVTIRLVDPRTIQAWDGPVTTYQVVVDENPMTIRGRIRQKLGGFPTETIPRIRVAQQPVVVHDSVIQGFTPLAGPTRIFRYDIMTREVTSLPWPAWLNDLAQMAQPYFAPDGRHVAYMATSENSALQLHVRRWPGGELVLRGPPAMRPTIERLRPVIWGDSSRVLATYASFAPGLGAVSLYVRARAYDRAVEVDTLPTDPEVIVAQAREARARDSLATLAAAPPPAPAPAPASGPPPAAAPPAEDPWDVAARQIGRFPPSRFSEVPAAFARELESLGCTIPQSALMPAQRLAPHNVIHGSFGAQGQTDWAALCSRGGQSTILVHWGGAAQCPRELAAAPDRGFLQGVGEVGIVFSRAIASRDTYTDYADSAITNVKLEHDGIDDAFQGKASTVWFCRGGKWLQLSGAD